MSATASKPRRGWRRAVIAVLVTLACVLALAAWVAWLNVRGEAPLAPRLAATSASPAQVERGAYLARAGNCMSCHTATGGQPFAGGRGVDTPFGVVMAPNLTPDRRSGLGDWSASEFWRAMHHGRSKDGRLLYPAFPYPNFTQVSREDSDALYAFLHSLPAVDQPNRPHTLRFPYSTQAALAVWRALYFRPAAFEPDAQQDAEWNRGKYLVQGLGHCAACHTGRNALGGHGFAAEFAGGLMPDAAWYAPSLASTQEAGVQRWSKAEVIALLRGGVSPQASVSGPMAEVVFASTQHLSREDVGAMARYLAAIPRHEPDPAAFRPADAAVMARGAKLYQQHCIACHGEQGEGAPGLYPALAGNRAVTLGPPHNLVQVIRHGGFLPATADNPQPFGMPPFKQLLSNEEIAALTTYLRQSWGHTAPAVSAVEVLRMP